MRIKDSKMFTFDREHEIKYAVGFVRGEESAEMLTKVISAVYDLLEEKISVADAKPILISCFSEGKSGVWESTGKWIRKLGAEYPDALDAWRTLASDNSATVRYRVACFLDEIPSQLRQDLGSLLLNDKSKKVKSMAEARLNEINST